MAPAQGADCNAQRPVFKGRQAVAQDRYDVLVSAFIGQVQEQQRGPDECGGQQPDDGAAGRQRFGSHPLLYRQVQGAGSRYINPVRLCRASPSAQGSECCKQEKSGAKRRTGDAFGQHQADQDGRAQLRQREQQERCAQKA